MYLRGEGPGGGGTGSWGEFPEENVLIGRMEKIEKPCHFFFFAFHIFFGRVTNLVPIF